MNLYQMIFKRRSIRKFKKEQVPEQLLKDILYFGENIPRLHGEILFKMEISENLDDHLPVKGLWKVEAPYYLTFYSEEKEGYLVNAGYIMEHVLLYMTGKGLGTCYLGSTKVLEPASAGMKQVIVVAFGYPKTLLYRDPATAKRLPLKELCVFKEEAGESMKNILRAVRLAPSAMNTQPWRFIVYHDRIYIFSCREFLPSPTLVSMREIGTGIMLSHLTIAAEEMWMNVKLEAEKAMEKKSYKSGAYVTTAFFKEYKY
ncbi:nitroreductase family protein [Lacrimispora saccharolytica]|uniref:Nitroreductase n=1 Tax=Lacrimispora saccharolytica (strain ATCC 35040 / DSM 2544 / NRCC 2533 / WM1) TaxID=610130 RepID=D9RAB4_LACSW|nr:nitroreductase family protein [Lacrimispora saccharolytica]ADL04192.1 nitroreductase [[Clostridium] saccharolyticum WM1]QRV21524.1 nitroreductase family protein [Lacrimispora saccharolytica]